MYYFDSQSLIQTLNKAKENIKKDMCVIEAVNAATHDFQLAQRTLRILYKVANLLDKRNVVVRGGLVGWQSRKSIKQKIKLCDDAIKHIEGD